MSVTEAPAVDLLAASRALVVEVRPSGVLIPKYDRAPEVPLDLASLQVLEALARPEGLTSSEADRPGSEDLIAALRDRGLLRDESIPGPPPGADQVVVGVEITLAPDDVIVLLTPVLLACGPDGFEARDHDGRLQASLSARELLALASFRVPSTTAVALDDHREALGVDALDEPTFEALARRLLAVGLLLPYDPDHPVHARRTRQTEKMRDGMRRQARVHQEFDRIEAEHDAQPGPEGRVRVVGFHTNWAGLPTSLGMVIAAAKGYEGGVLEQSYDFRPRLLWDRPRLTAVADAGPTIFLFSNYIWSTEDNLAHSALVKSVSPHHVTIHGGQNTPQYSGDLGRWFAQHPHVDIAVHGEGEATFPELLAALRGHVGDGPPDLSVLAEVPGLSYRTSDGVVQTAPRDRVADLDTLPSPALTGIFDGFIPAGGGDSGLIIETNRGCPYGCTFCDWGSATLSRIRKFDLDRVMAEVEWCAQNKLGIGIADANFGIFERDVEIAERIAALKASYGWPRVVGNNYAKNTVKHLSRIIEIFTEAGIVAEGKMSMQSFDAETLQTIKRKNIKVEKYHDLSVEFRRNGLPLVVELMMGLPGATLETLRNDLQACIDRDVRAALYETVLLPNSPMNDPDYRQENGIVAKQGEVVNTTATYTHDDFQEMQNLRFAFYVFENFGVLRQVASYVRAETGRREIDFYEQFARALRAQPERWPYAAVAVRVLPECMLPPVSWAGFLADVRRYLVEELSVPDDTALDSVLAVQHALQPARGRTFPLEIELAHDYTAWRAAVGLQRDAGHHGDWPQQVPSLRDMPPARFTVDDPLDSCGKGLGFPCHALIYYENSWDLDSPVSRPRQAEPEDAGVVV